MQELTKIVARQDANFKLSPSSSNETSINLSNEISNLISDESGEVSFRIYKDDLVKAISTLCLIPKVYMKKDTEPSKLYDILQDLSQQISVQFGESISTIYTINILKRDDGRAYFNNLKKPNGFNIRSFLVEQFSEITFRKNDDGSLEMRLNTLLPDDSIERKSVDTSATFDIDQPLQLIYYGAPGTGKSFTIDQVTNENNSVRTTFHPDSDYASFVGAYKPTMENVRMSKTFTSSKEGTYAEYVQKTDSHPGTEKKIVYKYVPQAFLKAYVEAWKRYSAGEDNPYYLVIEEINRGNCAQIFGDLFQLLDRNNMGCSSYAISADEDIAQFLREDDKGFGKLNEEQKEAIGKFRLKKDSGVEEQIGPEILNGSKLLLPPNLRIWATMNTSDQSLFPIDSAFKRRWNWEYMPIEYDPTDKNTGERLAWKFEVRGKTYYWGKFLDYINPKILKLTMSEDKQMGYFFAKPDKRGTDGRLDVISEKVFVNKVLFYLWTDVFKDYDLTEDPFVYKDKEGKNVVYRFTDFFPVENSIKLTLFVSAMNLDEVPFDIVTNSSTDEPTNDDGAKKGPLKTFRITMSDGKIISSKKAKDALISFVKYVGIERIRDLNMRSHKSEEAPDGVPFISKMTDYGFETWKPRHKSRIEGTDYYINAAWSVDDMINKLVSPIISRLGLEVESTEIILQSEYQENEAAD